jgi:hypothetical protein
MSLPLNVDPEHVLRGLQKDNASWHDYEFRHERTNQLVDPATLQIVIDQPTGVDLTKTWSGSDDSTWTRLGLGIFRARVVHNQAGIWRVQMTATVPTASVIGVVEVVDSFA